MTEDLQRLQTLVQQTLVLQTPVLSGNMQNHIRQARVKNIAENSVTMVIDAPFYDVNLWRKTGQIVYLTQPYTIRTGKNKGKVINRRKQVIGTMTSYAWWVNEIACFNHVGHHTLWLNRAVNKACEIYANSVGGVVDCKIEV